MIWMIKKNIHCSILVLFYWKILFSMGLWPRRSIVSISEGARIPFIPTRNQTARVAKYHSTNAKTKSKSLTLENTYAHDMYSVCHFCYAFKNFVVLLDFLFILLPHKELDLLVIIITQEDNLTSSRLTWWAFWIISQIIKIIVQVEIVSPYINTSTRQIETSRINTCYCMRE